MLNLESIWLAEYSVTQGCFHIETAREAMRNNLRQITEGWSNSYLPFAVCGSHEEANRACDQLQRLMRERGIEPGKGGAVRIGTVAEVLANAIN